MSKKPLLTRLLGPGRMLMAMAILTLGTLAVAPDASAQSIPGIGGLGGLGGGTGGLGGLGGAGGGGGSGAGTGSDSCGMPADDSQICTNHPFFQQGNSCSLSGKTQGILADIIREVYDAVQKAAEKMYQIIVGDSGFQTVVGASFLLFVTFFAVAFLFGFVQLTLGQGISRLIKIGLVAWVVSPAGWSDFNEYVVKFFNEGTIQLINEMIDIAGTGGTGGSTGGGGGGLPSGGSGSSSSDVAAPFKILDNSINSIFSPKMLVTAIAAFTTPPYGLMVGGALIFAIWEFIKAILSALQVYALSLIAKALLFGIAPIFFVFLLFERTRNLFQGWVNQLVNFSLQPILMFAFLAFFSTMIEASAKQILSSQDTTVCWEKSDKQGSSPFDVSNWRFTCNGKPYQGGYGTQGAVDKSCNNGKAFPISIVNILIFLLIVHIASKMIGIITTLAGELSSGITRLDQVGGTLSEWLGGRGGHSASDGERYIRSGAKSKTP